MDLKNTLMSNYAVEFAVQNHVINQPATMTDQNICTHLSAIADVKLSDKYVCEECIKNNGRWVHLRTCQTCGATLCCDSSPQTHMTKHYHESHHPVIASGEPGERWLWCYLDELLVEYL